MRVVRSISHFFCRQTHGDGSGRETKTDGPCVCVSVCTCVRFHAFVSVCPYVCTLMVFLYQRVLLSTRVFVCVCVCVCAHQDTDVAGAVLLLSLLHDGGSWYAERESSLFQVKRFLGEKKKAGEFVSRREV